MFNLETDLIDSPEELKNFLQGNYEKTDLLPGIDDTVTLTDAASVLGIATDTFIKFVVENNVKMLSQNRVKKSDLIDVILRNFLCNDNVFDPKKPKKAQKKPLKKSHFLL